MSFNSDETLDRCLHDVRSELKALGYPFEIVVGDNGSMDGSLATARRVADIVLDLRRNVGFGPAVNRLAEGGDWDWLVVLNPDSFIRPGDWAGLRALQDLPAAPAIARPRIVDEHGTDVPTLTPFPTPLGESLKYLIGRHRLRFAVVRRHEARTTLGPGYVQGALLIVNRGAWTMLGGFDERYFLYSEEVDLARRAWAAGVTLEDLPDVTVVHIGTGADEGKSPAAYLLLHESKWRYMGDAHGPREAAALRAAAVVGLSVRWARNTILFRSPVRRELRRKYGMVIRSALRWQRD